MNTGVAPTGKRGHIKFCFLYRKVYVTTGIIVHLCLTIGIREAKMVRYGVRWPIVYGQRFMISGESRGNGILRLSGVVFYRSFGVVTRSSVHMLHR